MPQYDPPPADLRKLNPIQRYMQKGELDRTDWLWLIAFVLFYFMMRPSIVNGAKWLFSSKEDVEGEDAQKAYQQRRAKAKIGVNEIRGGVGAVDKPEGLDLNDLDDEDTAVVSGSKSRSAGAGKAGVVSRKKTQGQTQTQMQTQTGTSAGVNAGANVAQINLSQSDAEKLLNWDDAPAGSKVQGGSADVKQWLDKWDE